MLAQHYDDNYFLNLNQIKNIECIQPTTEMMINFSESGSRAKKSCIVYAEKMDFKELVQLRVTEKCDQRRMYITTVDANSFHELKQDQALHVTFSGFVENLMHMLRDCQNNKLEINLVRKSTSDEFQLQFVEMRSFKNLVHLCLPCRAAPLNIVLFYVHNMFEQANKQIAMQEQITQQLSLELKTQQQRNIQLEEEQQKLHETLTENTRVLNERHIEQTEQLQNKIQQLTEQHCREAEKIRKSIVGVQSQLDRLNMEKSNLIAEKAQEQKRADTLNEEMTNLKTRLVTLKEQNEKLHAEMNSMKNYERKHDLNMIDARKQIKDLEDQLRKSNKEKANINAELEAEKKILHTKRQALEMASEEISKANQIIYKQNQELNRQKKTIDWRTEVAIQQEKAINEKEAMLRMRDEEIKHMHVTVEALQKEIPQQLDSMRKFAHSLELKYTNQIKQLQTKMLGAGGKENHVAKVISASCAKHK